MSLGRNEFVGLSARPTTALKSRVMACRMKRSACTSNYNPGVMICRAKRPTYNRIEIEGDGLPDEAFGLHFKLQSWRIDLSGEAFVLHSKLESWVGRALRPTIYLPVSRISGPQNTHRFAIWCPPKTRVTLHFYLTPYR